MGQMLQPRRGFTKGITIQILPPLTISDNGGTYTWVGSVDDARIWNRVLSSSEVTTIFAGGDPSITGLLAYWRIEEALEYLE